MVTVSFPEVSMHAEKRGKCLCGKARTRRKKFWQTQSPFNQKSRAQIYEELKADIAAWRAKPIRCAACSHDGEPR